MAPHGVFIYDILLHVYFTWFCIGHKWRGPHGLGPCGLRQGAELDCLPHLSTISSTQRGRMGGYDYSHSPSFFPASQPFIHRSIHPSVHLSIRSGLSIHRSIHPSSHLSVYTCEKYLYAYMAPLGDPSDQHYTFESWQAHAAKCTLQFSSGTSGTGLKLCTPLKLRSFGRLLFCAS